jgi:hypothetical protein
MIFKLAELYALTRSLPKLTQKELPIKTSFKLLKFLKRSSEEIEIAEKTRIKLVEKYAKERKDGEEMKVADENREKFQEEFSSLIEEEVNIDFELISIEELGNISVSAMDLVPLEKIIKEKM